MPRISPEANRAYVKKHYYAHREYYFAKAKAARDRKREFIQQAKTVPCKDCGQSYPYFVMQFDHLRDKRWSIANMLDKAWASIKDEISKCEVVCANCHAVRTHNRTLGAVA